MNMINPISTVKLTLTIPNLPYFGVRFVTSDVIATDRKFRYRFAIGGKLLLFKHILLSSIFVNNRVIVIKNGQKNFQLQLLLQLSTFENVQLQLQLQQNRVINYNLINYNYNFSKPGLERHFCDNAKGHTLQQESATYGPRAECNQPRHFTRPATFYCHPARDLFLFSMIDMQQ